MNYYQILGININASSKEISSAYRKLAAKYHPDLNQGKNAEDKFKEISIAYETLSDEKTKKNYDLKFSFFASKPQHKPKPRPKSHQSGPLNYGNTNRPIPHDLSGKLNKESLGTNDLWSQAGLEEYIPPKKVSPPLKRRKEINLVDP